MMINSPVILAIDTSLGPCSVAISQGGEVMAKKLEENTGQQSRVLVPMIEDILAESSLQYADCDALACTIGPGGFTGIRTGLTTARAISLVIGKPLIGLTTLEVIAYSAGIQGDILAIIDAYRGQWYVQRFRKLEQMTALSDPLLVEEPSLQALSHGAKKVQEVPYATNVAGLAYYRWMQGEREFPAAPLYIRAPDAKLPANEGLKSNDTLL
jgi:tRNA threonylcarbamoyladenosine biosynthesis protein TsaB